MPFVLQIASMSDAESLMWQLVQLNRRLHELHEYVQYHMEWKTKQSRDEWLETQREVEVLNELQAQHPVLLDVGGATFATCRSTLKTTGGNLLQILSVHGVVVPPSLVPENVMLD